MNLTLPMSGELANGRHDGNIESLKAISLNKDKKMSEREMREVANQFETMILRQLIKEMRKTIPEDGAIPQSHGTKMYMDMVDDHWAEQLAESQSLGLQEQIVEELKAKQDKIRTPERQTDFMNLNGRTENEFMPLKQNAEPEFINLPGKDLTFFDLPKDNPFMPLGSHPRLSTANIENWEGVPR